VAVEAVAARSFTPQGFRWPGLYIVSGHRTRGAQTEANPTTPFSHHRCCPSLAVDLRVGDIAAANVPLSIWEELAINFRPYGVRWGGANDPNHFFLGGIKCG